MKDHVGKIRKSLQNKNCRLFCALKEQSHHGDYSTPENCYSQTDIRNINRDFLEEYVKKRAISVLKLKHTNAHTNNSHFHQNKT